MFRLGLTSVKLVLGENYVGLGLVRNGILKDWNRLSIKSAVVNTRLGCFRVEFGSNQVEVGYYRLGNSGYPISKIVLQMFHSKILSKKYEKQFLKFLA